MTLTNIAALFGAMVALAIVPSLSVLVVVTRSATLGFIHGLATVLGIVIGDFVFIILAIYGLSAIAENMAGLFTVVKYLGGVYLIWLGIKLIKSKAKSNQIEITESSLFSSFLSGLTITLADQKAIFFYMSFFPAFLDLSNVTAMDTIVILAIAAIAVGGVKLGYAYMADKINLARSFAAKKGINLAAGSVMVSTGIFLIVKN